MVIKGLALLLALIATFSVGKENGKKVAEQDKLEIQNTLNAMEPLCFEDGSARGLRNMDDMSGKPYYALYVETDDERVWDATEVTGEGEETRVRGFAVTRYYTDELILAFEGKRYNEDLTDVQQITVTDSDGNVSTFFAVYTTVQQVEAVMSARGENPTKMMVQLGVLDNSYLLTLPENS